MTKRMEWTEKHWSVIEKIIRDNGATPWYAVKYQLTISSTNITPAIADELIRLKIKRGAVEVVRRGSSRKGGNLYLRIPDRTPRTMNDDDMRELRRLSK